LPPPAQAHKDQLIPIRKITGRCLSLIFFLYYLTMFIWFYNPKPLIIRQESTKNDVAASELSNPLCSIIDAVPVSSKEEKGKNSPSTPLRMKKDRKYGKSRVR
jgi:hypothetical protein